MDSALQELVTSGQESVGRDGTSECQADCPRIKEADGSREHRTTCSPTVLDTDRDEGFSKEYRQSKEQSMMVRLTMALCSSLAYSKMSTVVGRGWVGHVGVSLQRYSMSQMSSSTLQLFCVSEI